MNNGNSSFYKGMSILISYKSTCGLAVVSNNHMKVREDAVIEVFVLL